MSKPPFYFLGKSRGLSGALVALNKSQLGCNMQESVQQVSLLVSQIFGMPCQHIIILFSRGRQRAEMLTKKVVKLNIASGTELELCNVVHGAF